MRLSPFGAAAAVLLGHGSRWRGLGDYDLSRNTLVRVNDRNRNGQVAMSRTSAAFSGWSDYPSRGRRNVYSPCSGTIAQMVYAPDGGAASSTTAN